MTSILLRWTPWLLEIHLETRSASLPEFMGYNVFLQYAIPKNISTSMRNYERNLMMLKKRTLLVSKIQIGMDHIKWPLYKVLPCFYYRERGSKQSWGPKTYNGTWIYNAAELQQLVTNYYKSLFTKSPFLLFIYNFICVKILFHTYLYRFIS